MTPDEFRWVEWNIEHAQKHGCTIPEIESVVNGASRPYPRKLDAEKWIVVGRGTGGRFIEVIYLVDPADTAFVIHAMPVRPKGKRRRS